MKLIGTKLYLRPLEINDSLVSYKWRNDSDIWVYTGNKPNRLITPEIEYNWLKDVLMRKDELRFAIVDKEKEKYIGNIQLTKMAFGSAEYHIFIGEKNYWGSGFAYEASKLMIEYVKYNMNIKVLYLNFDSNHLVAQKLYLKLGFTEYEIGKMKLILF